LEERFPSHVVCAWLGNSVQVARKHYLQVTDEHFEQALQNPVQPAHEAQQNQVLQPAAIERNGAHEAKEIKGNGDFPREMATSDIIVVGRVTTTPAPVGT